MSLQILTLISWISVQLIHKTQRMKIYYFCSCFFCRVKSICLIFASSGQFNEVLTCSYDRQGTAALLFARLLSSHFRLGTSASCNKDLKLSQAKYRIFWSRLFRVFEQWEKWNKCTTGVLHIFTICDEKQQRVYGTGDVYSTIQKREKTSFEVLRFSQSDSSIPASCWVFISVVSQWLQWKHFIKYEAYFQKEVAEWPK